MGIKSTIRGGLAGIKRTLTFTQGEGGPHIDPLMPAPTPPASQDEASPYGMVRPTPEDGKAKTKTKTPISQFAEVPDSKPQKNIAKDQNYPDRDIKRSKSPHLPYSEPDPADPQGIKRPDFKPKKTMSQYDMSYYDGKGK